MNGTESLREKVEQQLRLHKGKFSLQGVFFVVSGILAATLSSATALHTELLIGAVLVATGAFQLALTLRTKMHAWSLLAACASIVAGTVILWKPFPVLFAVVTILAIVMTLEGTLELILSFRLQPGQRWNWMFFSGIAALVMAAVVWLGYPAFDVLYLSWIVAANLVLYGLALLVLVWKAAS